MPRMIDDDLFDAIAEDLKYCQHGESDFREDLLKAPSVEMLDLEKVERVDWDFEDDEFQGMEKREDGRFVRFSDLQSLVMPKVPQ